MRRMPWLGAACDLLADCTADSSVTCNTVQPEASLSTWSGLDPAAWWLFIMLAAMQQLLAWNNKAWTE